MEQTQYNLLFRWFIGLSMDDSVWVPTVFTKNRERLIRHSAVVEFFNEALYIAQKKSWLSGEHSSVDGTLIQAWAGHKSFVRKDGDDRDNDRGSGEGDFKGSKRRRNARVEDRSQCTALHTFCETVRAQGRSTSRRAERWSDPIGRSASSSPVISLSHGTWHR
jgi:hypothetical protein